MRCRNKIGSIQANHAYRESLARGAKFMLWNYMLPSALLKQSTAEWW